MKPTATKGAANAVAGAAAVLPPSGELRRRFHRAVSDMTARPLPKTGEADALEPSLYLLLVLINGTFEYCIITDKGRLGERILRRLRHQLFRRMLTFPVSYFHKDSSGQIVPMITAECESLGGFVDDAVALPAFEGGGTLLTNIFFMFMQDPLLGAAAVALYPIQGYVIPKLPPKVNRLGRLRVRAVRQVADRVDESATGLTDILANDGAEVQLAGFAHLLGTTYNIRFGICQRKFFVKFFNNFLGRLTLFFFHSIGGYLVIHGELSIGALLAVLIAYKDLASPWKEPLDVYQSLQDSRIKYEQIVEQFVPPGMTQSRLQLDEPETVMRLSGELPVANLTFAEDDRSCVLDRFSFSVPLDRQMAVIGQGKNERARALAPLIAPTDGRITIGSGDLAGWSMAVSSVVAVCAGISMRKRRPMWPGVSWRRASRFPAVSPRRERPSRRDLRCRKSSTATYRWQRICCLEPRSGQPSTSRRSRQNHVLWVLGKVNLVEDLLEDGHAVAETMVEMFADPATDHASFEQYSFIGAAALPQYAAILAHAETGGAAVLDKSDRSRLLSLPFKSIPARHRRDLIDENLQGQARRVFRADRLPAARSEIEFFGAERYMILDEATAALDGLAQVSAVKGVKEERVGRGLIWELHRAGLVGNFDYALVPSDGNRSSRGCRPYSPNAEIRCSL